METTKEIQDKIQNIIKDILVLEYDLELNENILNDTNKVDDLDMVEIIMAIEDEFDIILDDIDNDNAFFYKHNTINKLSEFVIGKL